MNSRSFARAVHVGPSLRLFAGFTLAVALCACAGSPGSVVPSQSAGLPSSTQSSGVSQTPAQGAKLELRIKIPRKLPHAHFVSPSTRSIVLSEGVKQIGVLNIDGTSKNCKIAEGSTFCQFRVGLTPGPHRLLTIKTFDASGGFGNPLSVGTVTRYIRPGLNIIALTLEGVVHSVALALDDVHPAAGTATTAHVTLTASDADGNIIVGSGVYLFPVTLSSSDTTGTVTLSPSTITAPGQSSTLTYNGASIEHVTISATAPFVSPHNVTGVTFSPKPTVLADYQISNPLLPLVSRRPHASAQQEPTAIAAGPDGHLWAAVSNSYFGIVKMSTSGSQFFYQAGVGSSINLPTRAITGLTAGADGNVWYVDQTDIGFIKPSNGSVTNYPMGGAAICPGPSGVRITPAADGGHWATLTCSSGSQIVHVAENGTFAFYNLPGFMAAQSLIVGKDGNVYVSGQVLGNSDAAVAQAVVSGGAVTSVNVLDVTAVPNLPLVGMAQSTDGDLWVTTGSCAPSAFVRIHLATAFQSSPVSIFPTLGCSRPFYLTALPNGTLWAPDNAYAGATRVIPGVYPAAPVQFELLLPTPGSVSGAEFDTAVGPDGNLYFSDDSSTPTSTGDIAKVAY